MNKEKIYFCRYYDQWKGKDIKLVEDEKDVYDLYIQAPDLDMTEGSINTIIANFRVLNGEFGKSVRCEIYDANKRIFKVTMPLYILTNNGKYEVDFEVTYNQIGSNKSDERTAIQTFTIIDSIEIDNSEMVEDDRYDILKQLIDDLKNHKVDTSSFASKEEMQNAIDTAMEDVSIENIMAQLKDEYVTNTQMVETLKKYQTTFDMAAYAKASDLNSYVKNVRLYNDILPYYAKLSELNKYILKEEGKTLTSNDFTNELKDKLVNMPDKGVEFDDSELREMIDKKASRDFVLELFGDIQSIDLTKYYTIEEMTTIIDEINKTHSTNIDNLEDDVENTYLKKEDYEYADGINTDDVKVNEEQSKRIDELSKTLKKHTEQIYI